MTCPGSEGGTNWGISTLLPSRPSSATFEFISDRASSGSCAPSPPLSSFFKSSRRRNTAYHVVCWVVPLCIMVPVTLITDDNINPHDVDSSWVRALPSSLACFLAWR